MFSAGLLIGIRGKGLEIRKMDDYSNLKSLTPNPQPLSPKSIIGFDTGIKDNIYFLSNEFFENELKPFLNSLLPDKDFDKSKIEIPSREILKKVKSFLQEKDVPTNFTYGGTTANIFYNISSILSDSNQKIDIKFVATGKDSLDDLKKKNVKIFLSEKSENYAESVLIYLGDSRSKRTLIYRGDFKKVIEENLEEAKSQVFQDNSLYMLMGSVLGKVGRDNFSKIILYINSTADSVYTLNLPTDKDTSLKYNEYLFGLMRGAAIIFSNLEELCFMFAPDLKEKDCFDNFAEGDLSHFERSEKSPSDNEISRYARYDPNKKAKEVIKKLQQILSQNSHALITAGEFGAFLVFKGNYEFIPALRFEGKPYSNGAGDTTIGAYLSSLLLGFEPQKALEIAMKCAHEKLKFNSSRLPDVGAIFAAKI